MADQPSADPADAVVFPRDMTGPTTYYEVWEYHGEKPVRRVSLGVWERGYVNQAEAEQDAVKLAADPAWTRFKTDPSFRVVTVSTTRTPAPASSVSASVPTSTSTS